MRGINKNGLAYNDLSTWLDYSLEDYEQLTKACAERFGWQWWTAFREFRARTVCLIPSILRSEKRPILLAADKPFWIKLRVARDPEVYAIMRAYQDHPRCIIPHAFLRGRPCNRLFVCGIG